MNRFALPTVAAAVALSLIAVRAEADDAATSVQTKITGAMKAAKSFVVTTLYPAQSYSSTIVHVAPDRSRVVVAVAATTTDIVTLGDTQYSSKNGTPFERGPVEPEERARLESIGSVKVGAVHPDVTVDGVTYGAFETTVALGGELSLTCTYDKKTYRLVRCANADVTQMYKKYNDPANVVVAPSDVAQTSKGAN